MTEQAKKKLPALKAELGKINNDLSKLERALKKKKSRHRHGFLCQFLINSSKVELATLNNDLSKLEKKVERAIPPALRAHVERNLSSMTKWKRVVGRVCCLRPND